MSDTFSPDAAASAHVHGADGPRPIVLITGSSGFLGAACVDRFAPDYYVVGLSRKDPPPTIRHAFEFRRFDLEDHDTIDAIVADLARRKAPIASVIHLAAYVDFSGRPSDKYQSVTVEGTRHLLRRLRDLPVEQFIFSSSMLVMRSAPPPHRISEEDPLDPDWAYPESKVQTEQVIREERGPIPAVIMRIAGVYTDRGRLLPLVHQIERIDQRWMTSHVFPGDLSHGQAAVHRDDLLDAIAAAIERRRELAAETTFLIGEPETMSYGQLQRQLGVLIHDKAWWTLSIPKPLAWAGAVVQNAVPIGREPFIKPWMVWIGDHHYALNIDRARHLLGWSPRHRLRESLPAIIESLKRDRRAWYEHNGLVAR